MLELIGEGATGRVWRARQDAMDREVALKIIVTEGNQGLRRALRLEREARLSGALDHPGLVRGIAAGEGEGFSWFAMELVRGQTLEQRVQDEGALAPDEVLRIGRALAGALAHAHAHEIVHRDVKPANVMLEAEGGRPRLLDLGLARRAEDPRLTRDSGTLGTPQYMAPEQARDPSKAAAAADVFALGATLWTSLAGKPPFEGSNVAQVLTALLYEDPPELSRVGIDAPPGLEELLRAMLAKQVADRPASMRAVDRALDRIGRGRPARARSESPGARGRRKGLLIGGAVMAFLIVIGLIATSATEPADPDSGQREPRGIEVGDSGSSHRELPNQADSEARSNTWLDEARRLLDRTGATAGHELLLHLAARPEGHDPEATDALAERLQARWEQARSAFLAAVSATGAASLQRDGDAEEARLRLARQWDREILDLAGPPESRSPDLAARVAADRQRLAQELEDAITRVAERQLAAALTGLETLESSLANQQLDRSALERRIDRELPRSARLALDAARRERFEAARAALVTTLTLGPIERWNARRRRIETALAPDVLKLLTARKEIRAARREVTGAGALAREELERLERRHAASLEEVRERVAALEQIVLRRDPAPLRTADILERATRLEEAIRSVAPEPEEVPGIQEDLASAARWTEALRAAAGLRESIARGLAARGDEAIPITMALWERGSRDPRPAIVTPSLRRGGVVRLTIDRDGRIQTLKLEDLDADRLLRLARRLELPADSLSALMLAHAEGDDLPAWRIWQVDLAARSAEEGIARQGLKVREESFDRDVERMAFRDLTGALSAELAGRDSEAAAVYSRIVASTPRELRSRWWRVRKVGLQRSADHLRAEARERDAWRSWQRFAVTPDSESERRYRVPLGGNVELRGIVVLPAAKGISREDGGIRLAPDSESMRLGPELAPALELRVPEPQAGRMDIRLLGRWRGEPGFAQASWHGVHWLHVEALADDLSHRSRRLHGLERRLTGRERPRKEHVWSGDVRAWRAGWPEAFRRAGSLRAEDGTFSFDLSLAREQQGTKLRFGTHEGVVITGGGEASIRIRASHDLVIEAMEVRLTDLP